MTVTYLDSLVVAEGGNHRMAVCPLFDVCQFDH